MPRRVSFFSSGCVSAAPLLQVLRMADDLEPMTNCTVETVVDFDAPVVSQPASATVLGLLIPCDTLQLRHEGELECGA